MANERLIKWKRFLVMSSLTILAQFFVSAYALADVQGPGCVLGTADPVSPGQSKAYFQSLSSQKIRAMAVSASSFNISPGTWATAGTDEIQELARALNHDPKQIYDYVHNYIEYVPYFGSLKGATLTLLDRTGNDFDQASLMIALLRASGYTANFVHGTKFIPTASLASWLGGTSWSTAAVLSAAQSIWASGGIPVTNNGSGLTVEGVWVDATINGTDCFFDPTDKMYINKSKIDISGAMGYNRINFLNAVTSGATITSNSVQNLNQTNLNNKLTEYATNLSNTIRSQYPNSDISDIIGGRKIQETHMTQYSGGIPNSTTMESWTDIPAFYLTTLRVQHVGIDRTFTIPEIGTQRLTITYAGSTPQLREGGILVASGNSTITGNKYDLVITVDHPYPANNGTYCDQTATWNCISGSTYAIVSSFAGGKTDTLIRERQDELSQNLARGYADTSEYVLGETLNIMGITWMKEDTLTKYLFDSVANTVSLYHHSIAVMAQETGYFIDARMAILSTCSKSQLGYYDQPSFKTLATIGSAYEHTVLEQLMGSNNPCASTIKLMQIANSQGGKVFLANSGNFASIQTQLRNYSTQTLIDIQNAINAGGAVILPDNGQLTLNKWRGTAYASKSTDGVIGMIIGGGYFGGYGSTEIPVTPEPVLTDVQATTPDISYSINTPSPVSSEPVNLATCAYLCDHTDLAIGEKTPIGMEFHRSYNSSRNWSRRSMGYGWQHNYDIFLSRVSDYNPGLGLRTPIDAVAMITDLYISNDLMMNDDNLIGWMAMFLSHKWATDQLIDNAISVNMGGQVTEYVKLPDDSYDNPPGITTELVDNGNSTFSLKERSGAQMNFDTNNQITQLRDVDGNTLDFSYSGNKLTSIKNTVGRSLTLNYTGDNISSVNDSEGRSVSYSYDSYNNLNSYTDVMGKTWAYIYDGIHRMYSQSNPLGITTVTNRYNNLSRVQSQTVPRQNGTATYNFYFSGLRNIEENPFGKQTIYYLDEEGRTYAIEDALHNKTVKTFDGQNHALTINNANQNTTTFNYDGNQNLTKIINSLNKETNYTYDAEYNLTDTSDSLNHVTHFDYNAQHHLTKTTDAETNTASFAYYANGQVEDSTDGRGTTTIFTYDSNNYPLSVKTASHSDINYSYDRIGRIISLTDQQEAVTTFTYDNQGLLLTRKDPLGRTASFTYDDVGRIISCTDRNGNTITYAYTPSDKLKTVTYPDSSKIAFTYDLDDKLINMQDTIGQTTYTYDDANRSKSVTNSYAQVVSYEYDAVGNVTKIIYPDGKAVTYTYDKLNHLKTVTNWLSQTAVYIYDDAGRLTNLTNFNGTVVNYGYDKANRMISLENKNPNTEGIISSYSYTLDANGNRTGISQQEPIAAPSTPVGTINYTYNSTKNRLLNAGSTNFTYDNEGELSTGGSASYSFDYEHRLKTINGTSFVYDGKGNRLAAIRGSAVTRYIYDAAGNLLAETDSTNIITRYYIYGSGLLAMVTPTGQTYTYHYNAIGSTIAMTDQNEKIVNKYAYTPFGSIASCTEMFSQPFKFNGQYGVMYEPSGLYYMRARYYDPSVGRFISEDPSGFNGGDVNLYAYCGNSPINFADPFGLCVAKNNGWTNAALGGIGVALIGLTADDATVIGIADDALIPILAAAGVGVVMVQAIQNRTDNGRTSQGYKLNELGTETRMPSGAPGLPPGGSPPPPGWQKWGYIAAKVLELTWKIFGPK